MEIGNNTPVIGETGIPDQAEIPEEGGVYGWDDGDGPRWLLFQVLARPRGHRPRHGECSGNIYAGRQRLQQARLCVILI